MGNKGIILIIIIMIVILLAGVGFFIFATRPNASTSVVSNTPCPKEGRRIEVVIDSKGLAPTEIDVKQCDRLVFVNKDTKLHEPAFGTHDLHIPYPGYNEDILMAGTSVDFLLTEIGEFELHDHINPQATGKIIISN
ncbi:hypothetical protein HY045_03020 [Candidatus Woesebacteria bacterium]|nr:hypothetical protein [Candidatus Woesebacteria bacterium]